MSEVYLVGESSYEGFNVDKVFSSKEACDKYIEFLKYTGNAYGRDDIEEYDLKDDFKMPSTIYATVKINFSGDCIACFDFDEVDDKSKYEEPTLEIEDIENGDVVYIKLYFVINTKDNESKEELEERAKGIAKQTIKCYMKENGLKFYNDTDVLYKI